MKGRPTPSRPPKVARDVLVKQGAERWLWLQSKARIYRMQEGKTAPKAPSVKQPPRLIG